MAGNVWEWTSSPHGNSTDNRMVLCGGSWLSGARYARAACRDQGWPDYFYGDFGFRLVVSAVRDDSPEAGQ